MAELSYLRRSTAEGIGTAFLVAAIVGSGIMGERLFRGQPGLTLLANSLATGAALVALILLSAPLSGAHFNPLVTLAVAWRGGLPRREVAGYVVAQIAGGLVGVAATLALFGEPLVASHRARAGAALPWSEAVATFGLLSIVMGVSRQGPRAVALAVGAYITAGYWFTPSTAFANPAVTLARALTDTFTGIRLQDVPGFVLGQCAGALAAVALFHWYERPAQRRIAP